MLHVSSRFYTFFYYYVGCELTDQSRTINRAHQHEYIMASDEAPIDVDVPVEQENEMFRCRHYENKYPEVDDLIVVQVKSIADIGARCTLCAPRRRRPSAALVCSMSSDSFSAIFLLFRFVYCVARFCCVVRRAVIRRAFAGAYVSLLEYENIEGMIPLTELSNRRIRSFHKLIRVGRIEIAVVLRVDKEKGVWFFRARSVCLRCRLPRVYVFWLAISFSLLHLPIMCCTATATRLH